MIHLGFCLRGMSVPSWKLCLDSVGGSTEVPDGLGCRNQGRCFAGEVSRHLGHVDGVLSVIEL